jgi:hypothetical protein
MLITSQDQTHPYLRVTVGYTRIASKVWRSVATFNNTNDVNKDDMGYLDWQVLQWTRSIPESLKLSTNERSHEVENNSDRTTRRLQSLLYLRGNQMRILIHRPILHSAAHMARYSQEADTVVEIAKDTIRFLTNLNKISDIYQQQQITFNWFLVSALAVLFLAVAQNSGQYSHRCKEEFYMAIELVKHFSTQSYISKRLWRSIKSLKKVAPKVGLQKDRELAVERNAGSNAPYADGMFFMDPIEAGSDRDVLADSPFDGPQISQELMDWFESFGEGQDPLSQQNVHEIGATQPWSTNFASVDAYDNLRGVDGLSSVIRDCF